MNERKEEAPPPPPPRAVSFRDCLALGKAKGFSFFLFLLLSVGMGILFTKICRGLPPGPDAVLDSRHALAKTGRLLRPPYPSHSRVNGRRPWVLEFSFTLPGGKEYRGYSYTFSRRRAASLALRGSNLPVEYDPRDPERARIQGTRASFVPAWLFLIPAIFFAVTLVLGLWWIASSLKLHALAVYGRACKARLEEIRPVTGVNPPPWRVSWTLEEPLPGVPPQGRVDHGHGAAHPRFDRDGLGRAVLGAGPALHAGVPVLDEGLFVPQEKDPVGADLGAEPAADALFRVHHQAHHRGQVTQL